MHERDLSGAEDGELVVVDLPPGGPRHGPRKAVVAERLGDPDHPKAISLISIHQQGIPTEFPKAALETGRSRNRAGARRPHRPCGACRW